MEIIALILFDDDGPYYLPVFGKKLISPKGLDNYIFYVHKTADEAKPPYSITETGTGALVATFNKKKEAQSILEKNVIEVGLESLIAKMNEVSKINEEAKAEIELAHQRYLASKPKLLGKWTARIDAGTKIPTVRIKGIFRSQAKREKFEINITEPGSVIPFNLSVVLKGSDLIHPDGEFEHTIEYVQTFDETEHALWPIDEMEQITIFNEGDQVLGIFDIENNKPHVKKYTQDLY